MRKILLILLALAFLGCALHLDQSHLQYGWEEEYPRYDDEKEEPQEVEEPYIPELTLYIGQGYNFYQGNPMTKSLDPGFTMPIFNFTFDNGEKTGDGQYRIPDHTLSRLLGSCSYDSFVKSYKGARSYQKQLETFVEVEGGYDSWFTKVAFSLSTNLQNMEKKTQNEHSIVTQAYSECQVYKVFLDSTKHLTLRESFTQAVKNALRDNKWEQFINKYGTHYIVEGTLGGRAVQQMSFSQDSESKFKAQGSSIEIGASAEFWGFFVGTQVSLASKQKDYNLAENMKKERHEFFIGGRPTSKGNSNEWMKQVQKRPMPIKYKIKDISHLFELIEGINIDDAKAKFKTGMVQYCQKNSNCKEPSSDYIAPPPPKAIIPPPPPPRRTQCMMRWQGPFGGSRGIPFQYQSGSPQFLQLKGITVWSGNYIDAISLVFDGIAQGIYRRFDSPKYGGSGGRVQGWSVPSGQYISTVIIKAQNFVDGIQFVTNYGQTSPWFGGRGGQQYRINVGNGRIVGFNGGYGNFIDRIGFGICQRY